MGLGPGSLVICINDKAYNPNYAPKLTLNKVYVLDDIDVCGDFTEIVQINGHWYSADAIEGYYEDVVCS